MVVLFFFEMCVVVVLLGDWLVVIYYGFYSIIVGVGVFVGNLVIGLFMSVVCCLNIDEIVWGGLILVGIVVVVGFCWLDIFILGF